MAFSLVFMLSIEYLKLGEMRMRLNLSELQSIIQINNTCYFLANMVIDALRNEISLRKEMSSKMFVFYLAAGLSILFRKHTQGILCFSAWRHTVMV